METSGPTSGIPQTLAGLQRPVSLQLQVGQQLQATVLDNSAGKILLAIGHRQLSAESSLPFERGQALTLQVRSLGEQPVLRVIAALQESPTAMAVRALLPRYGASTPLLASLSQLAQTPQAPVPPLIHESVRALVRELPDMAALSTPRGVKTALQNSGGFLENHLARAGQAPPAAIAVNSDYKANLVRLVNLLHQWPGSSQAPTTQRSVPASATERPATPATPTSPPAPATSRVISPSPATPLPSGPLTPQAPPGQTLAPPTAAPPATTTPSATEIQSTPPSQQTQATQTAQSQTVQRAIQNAATPVAERTATQTPAATGSGVPTSDGGRSVNPVTPGTVSLNPPPPFAGVVPTPQAPLQASLDLLNRLGNLRLDLLQQTEAALARVQLNQLASLPREGEHRLVEWLFDIPVRRGNDIDLWSARLYRDAEGDAEHGKPAAEWSVQLAFDLPGLGPMQAQINLHGERVSTHFWAVRHDTLPLLRDNLHALREAMLEAGLDVGDIDCQLGAIPESPDRNQDPLINEKV